MYMRGGKLAYAPGAVVEEPTPLSRMTLGWLIKRRFRSGQSISSSCVRMGR
jgi:succinoglycan biosynthesis protein ExoM